MTEEEQRALANRLSERSRFVGFDTALELVRRKPAEAERLIREREEGEAKQEELSQALRRFSAAARELR